MAYLLDEDPGRACSILRVSYWTLNPLLLLSTHMAIPESLVSLCGESGRHIKLLNIKKEIRLISLTYLTIQ